MQDQAGLLNSDNGMSLPVVETAASAVAAREKAEVEARYIIAFKRPRDMDEVRARLLRECERPGFAAVAKYAKPVGGQKIVGLSIRFAEAALRCMTNVMPQVLIVFDDSTRRILRVSVTDLEANVTYGQDLILEKTVERRNVKEGTTVVGERTNTGGNKVYIVEATEDELANKANAAISKAVRNHGLRLLPGDILDECSRKIDQTQRDRAAKDPNAEKKELLDAFASINIMPARLKEYLGHPVEEIVEAELVDLRQVYQAIRDGETTWGAVMEAKAGGGDVSGEQRTRLRPVRKEPEGGQSQAAAADGSASSSSGEQPKQEPAASEPKAQPAAEQKSAPSGGGSFDGKRMSEIYAAMPGYNRKHGEGAAAAELGERYNVDSLTKLTPEQADQFLKILKA